MSSTKVKKQLKELLKKSDNKFCADCPIKGPTWASINIGVFLCLQCAGIHRDIGVHITKVRSAELDTWQQDWVDVMKKWGNKRANKYWEASCPKAYSGRPTENEAQELSAKLKRFIRDKYERKLWIPKEGDDSESESESSSSSSSSDDEEARRQQRRRERHRLKKEKELQKKSGKVNLKIKTSTKKKETEPVKKDEPDLLFGFSDPAPAATPNSVSQAPVSQAQPTNNTIDQVTADFANFSAQPVPQAQQPPVEAPAQQQAPPTQAQKATNIMAMFSKGSNQGMTYGMGMSQQPNMMVMNQQPPNMMMSQQPNMMMSQQPNMMMNQQPPNMMMNQQPPNMMMNQQPNMMMNQQQQPNMMMNQQPNMMMSQQQQPNMMMNQQQQPNMMMSQQQQQQQPNMMMNQQQQPNMMMGQQQQQQQPNMMMNQQQQPNMMMSQQQQQQPGTSLDDPFAFF